MRKGGRVVGYRTLPVTYGVVEYDCEHCRKPFQVVDSGLAASRQRFCSDACRQAAYRKRKSGGDDA
jgi:hypothetical protein